MSVYQLSNDALTTLARRIVDRSMQSPAIREAVARYGYDEAALQEGQALVEAFETRSLAQQNEQGQQLTATDALRDAWDAFHAKTYMPHVTIARLVFDDAGTQRRLGIDGQRPRGLSDYLQEARRFYTTLTSDADLAAAVAERGLTAEKLEAALTDLDELEALDVDQEAQKAEAQQATRARDDGRRALAEWVAEYQKFAELALSDQPDLAEQLGLLARSA